LNHQDSEEIVGSALALLFGLQVHILPTAAQAPCVFYSSVCCQRFIPIPKINYFPYHYNLTYILTQVNQPNPPPQIN